MKKRIAAVVLALAALAVLGGTAAAAEEAEVRVEKSFAFDKVDDMMEFISNAGTWSLAEGTLKQEARSGVSDYVFIEAVRELTLTWSCAVEGVGAARYVGVSFGKQRPKDTPNMSGYYIRLYGDRRLTVTDDHAARTLLEIENAVSDPEELNEFRLVQEGDSYSLSVNGGEPVSFRDEKSVFPAGFAGVVTNGPAVFDAFSISGVRVGGLEQCLEGNGIGGEYGREEQSGNMDIREADDAYAERIPTESGDEDDWFNGFVGRVNGGSAGAGESTVIPREKRNPVDIALLVVGGVCLAGAAGLAAWLLILRIKRGKKNA